MKLTHRKLRFAGAMALAAALVVACSSTPTTPTKTDCKAGDAYFCRCADRQEGTRVCNDDGFTYGPCEPCFPIDPPLPEEDGSFPDEDVFVPPSDAGDGGDAGPCPNGTVDPGEECDDGNRTANDGCSATCTLQAGPTTGDKCPGMAVHVWDKAVALTGSTAAPYVNDYTTTPAAACNNTSGSTTPERVFAVTAHKTGMLRVATSAANFDHMLYRGDTCPATGNSFTNLSCANTVAGNGGETLTFAVTSGITYYVVVEGGAVNQQGNFNVTFSIP